MKNNIVKIIRWILFWFYLIPYYLLKNFIFKKTAKSTLWANCTTITLLAVLGLIFSPSSNTTVTSSSQQSTAATTTKVIHKSVTKKIGTSAFNKEKARNKVLKQEQKNKQAEYDKLKKQLDTYHEKEKKQKQKAEQERKIAEE